MRKNNRQRKVPAEKLVVLNVIRSANGVKDIALDDFIFSCLVEIEAYNFALLEKLKKCLIHPAVGNSAVFITISG